MTLDDIEKIRNIKTLKKKIGIEQTPPINLVLASKRSTTNSINTKIRIFWINFTYDLKKKPSQTSKEVVYSPFAANESY